MAVITEVILPVLFVVLLGYLLRRFGKLDEHVLSRTQLYVLGPALIFMTMAGSEAEMGLLLKVMLHVALLSALLLVTAQLAGKLFKSDRIERNAMSISAVFSNSGFYGIPVCMLAFGDEGMIFAAVYVVCSSMIQSTVGIYLASAGNRSHSEAFLTIFKVPLIYAIIFGKLLSHFSLLPPEPFMKMINLLGRSAIPLGLILLGMQLQRIISERKDRKEGEKSYIVHGMTAGWIKIIGGLVFGLLLLRFIPFDGILRDVIIVQSAMPTAVNAVVYATEFDCRPKLVTIAIMTATLTSILSISLILHWLG
jgi:predicted permease